MGSADRNYRLFPAECSPNRQFCRFFISSHRIDDYFRILSTQASVSLLSPYEARFRYLLMQSTNLAFTLFPHRLSPGPLKLPSAFTSRPQPGYLWAFPEKSKFFFCQSAMLPTWRRDVLPQRCDQLPSLRASGNLNRKLLVWTAELPRSVLLLRLSRVFPI